MLWLCEDQASESGEAFMIIVGCDFHPSWQQVMIFDSDTGEISERKLVHGNGEAEQFYQGLTAPALIGLESCGNSQWFVDLLERLGHQVWIGDAAQIRVSYVRKQKTDKRDAAHIVKLLIEGRFPRVWTPDSEVRDLRQLLIHRHRLIQIRTKVKNGLQHLALNRGMQKKHRLWTEAGQRAFLQLPLPGWASCRREDLLRLLARLEEQIRPLDEAVEKAAWAQERARLLMTQPGVGPVTALAFVLTIGDASRFARGKQVASYLGLIPSEHSSSGKQRLGAISKQGNSFMRMLLVEAAQTAVRLDEGMKKKYQHRCHSKIKGIAKVAAARKLAVRLYWMLRTNTAYPEIVHNESSSRCPMAGAS
jgi:transposase